MCRCSADHGSAQPVPTSCPKGSDPWFIESGVQGKDTRAASLAFCPFLHRVQYPTSHHPRGERAPSATVLCLPYLPAPADLPMSSTVPAACRYPRGWRLPCPCGCSVYTWQQVGCCSEVLRTHILHWLRRQLGIAEYLTAHSNVAQEFRTGSEAENSMQLK